jgi:hypothetical protein
MNGRVIAPDHSLDRIIGFISRLNGGFLQRIEAKITVDQSEDGESGDSQSAGGRLKVVREYVNTLFDDCSEVNWSHEFDQIIGMVSDVADILSSSTSEGEEEKDIVESARQSQDGMFYSFIKELPSIWRPCLSSGSQRYY